MVSVFESEQAGLDLLGMNSKADKKDLTRRLTEIVGVGAVLADDPELVVYECDAYTVSYTHLTLPTICSV